MPTSRTPPSFVWLLLTALVVTSLASCSERRADRQDDATTGGTATTRPTTSLAAPRASDDPSTTTTPTAAAPEVRPATDPAGETIDLTIETADGRDRSALVHVPASLPDGPVPLLVALHGGTGSGAQFQRTSGYDGLAEANGFIVVYPDGVGSRLDEDLLRTWNGGICCGRAARDDVDDVAFLRQLVGTVSDDHDIDADRVYASGHSNGMIMSYRLACEASDVFVAVAGQAGTLGVAGCSPTEPVSVLHLHGAADTSVPIDGGRGEGISGVDFPSPRNGIRTVAASVSCDPTATVVADGPATTETWEACAGGVTIAFVTVDGASHAWMGADRTTRPGGPEPFADYDASLAVWTFLAAHPRTS